MYAPCEKVFLVRAPTGYSCTRPKRARIGATRLDFLRHFISAVGFLPDANNAKAATTLPMPTIASQLRYLLGGLSPIAIFFRIVSNDSFYLALLKQGVSFVFTQIMEACCTRTAKNIHRTAGVMFISCLRCSKILILPLPTARRRHHRWLWRGAKPAVDIRPRSKYPLYQSRHIAQQVQMEHTQARS